MNNLKYILLALLLGSAGYSAKAQSSNFSQYHLTPLYTSPAELGTSGYFQVLGHYRKQSLSQDQGYENFALSSVYPLYYKDNGRRFGGVGIGIMNESSGMMGMLQESSIKAGYAYNLQVTESHHVSLGLQGGYYRRNINLSKIRTDNQYQKGVYAPGSALGENFSDDASQAFKADVGATWYMLDEYGEQKLSLGIAAFNVNKANYEFLSGSQEQALPLAYHLYGSLRAVSKDKMHVVPTFRYMQEKNYSQLNLGSLFLYQLQEGTGSMQESHLGLGAWYSLDNAAIFSLEFVQPSYVLSISYDLPASSNIEKIQVNNGVEVTFGWRLKRGKGRNSTPKKTMEIVAATAEEKPLETAKFPEQAAPMMVEKQPEPAPMAEESEEATAVFVHEPVIKEPVLTDDERALLARTIHFDLSKPEPNTDSKGLLDKVVDILHKEESLNIELIGYTCNIGDAIKNQQISLKRAERTKQFLVDKGIAAERISIKGRGEADPIMTNDTSEGREQNRRVEINIVE